MEPKKDEEISTLLEEEIPVAEVPIWDHDVQVYLSNFRKKLQYARDQRESPHEEFDGMTYSMYWLQNERWANTYIPPKKNKDEITYQSGTLRKKLEALVSSVVGLNLQAEYMPFDEHDIAIAGLGNAIEDVKEKVDELDNAEEKDWVKIHELAKQGTIFTQEIWNDATYNDKELTGEFDGKFKFDKWSNKEITPNGRPESKILDGRTVYLGNLKKYFIENQPFVYTLETKTYRELKPIFEEFENWKYVSFKKRESVGAAQPNVLTSDWTLENHPDGTAEIIKYQSVDENEYQVMINGIPMFPIGFPLPWGRRYNIDQQNLDVIRHDFSYGKSFVFKNKNLVGLLDEMTKGNLWKFWQSIKPSMINTTGQVIPQNIFTPGKISMGIPDGGLKPVYPQLIEGVTNAEANMLQNIKANIDENTVSQQFTGAAPKGNPTATEIMEIQRQSRMMLGTMILAVSLLKKKESISRLLNILQNWFNPLDTEIDQARQTLKNKYRITSRTRNIKDKGQGYRFTIPTDEKYTPAEIDTHEQLLSKKFGKPVQVFIINPEELKEANLTWQTVVNAKEKKSSDFNKVMFKQKVSDAIALGLPISQQYVMEQFAEVWGDDPAKLFDKGGGMQPNPMMQNGQNGPVAPVKIKPPVPGSQPQPNQQ